MFSKNIKIPYSKLRLFHSQNSISNEYLTNYDKVKSFYDFDYRSVDSINDAAEQNKLSSDQRKELYKVLYDFNKEKNNHPKVMDNLNCLVDNDCYTIITGQQCGLLTGPLYTIYKGISAILLADKLNKSLNKKFIPIFWVASEDHDLNEVNNLSFSSLNNEIESLSLDIEDKGFSIKDIDLKDEIYNFLNILKDKWHKTEFSSSMYSLVKEKSNSLLDSFIHLISEVFKDYGLIIVEPNILRKLSIDISLLALNKNSEINKLITESSKKLTKLGYNPAINNSNGLNLFYHHNKARLKLIWNENSNLFENKKNQLSFSLEELKLKIVNDPHLFSHNVVLRPIVQDYLFPNAVYIAGPGEINYFSQLKSVYALFNKRLPVIYPRISITLFEKRYQKIQNKFGLTIIDILNNNSIKANPLFNTSDDIINIFILNIERNIKDLTLMAEKQGQNVIDSIRPSLNKILSEGKKVKAKYIKRLEENLGISKNQIVRLNNAVIPRIRPQERVFNYFYYINYYGLNLLSEIISNVDINDFSHQVLYYE